VFRIGKRLGELGVIGMNRRNAEFVLPYNPRKYFPRVDDKLITKNLAIAAGIDVPPLYGVIEIERQARDLPKLVSGFAEFVIKPARGSGGEGITVIDGHENGGYRKASGEVLTGIDLCHHASNILSGMYSLGGQPDKVMVEYRVHFDPVFDDYCYRGVPDVRILVFLGVPVMAMIRLPTRQSDGRANLHQGAIGAGIDLATGRTLSAVRFNDIIQHHPDTGRPIAGIEIPHWRRLLELASRCHGLTGLGYQGADFVIDRDRGPLLLELNARPGLNVQIANHTGLLPRLRDVEQHIAGLDKPSACVDFAVNRFGQPAR
jgi:alpha-L-glutamate ligase-like protein